MFSGFMSPVDDSLRVARSRARSRHRFGSSALRPFRLLFALRALRGGLDHACRQ